MATQREDGRRASETSEADRRRGRPPPPGVINAGTPVYDVIGKRLGTVVVAHHEARCLEMRRGRLRQRTVYVPLWAIEQTGRSPSISAFRWVN